MPHRLLGNLSTLTKATPYILSFLSYPALPFRIFSCNMISKHAQTASLQKPALSLRLNLNLCKSTLSLSTESR